ncbi:hypothetical protein M3Y97_01032300 [Aphelenchoides bicaudatus]|nr:hypothetical protein M3Y97_01032300 [Aphelenchoides bicaudatus]
MSLQQVISTVATLTGDTTTQSLASVLTDKFTMDQLLTADGIYYTFSVLAPLVSFILLLRFYWLSRQKQVALSYQLKVHLLAWLVSLTFGFCFFITIFSRYFTPPELEITDLTSELIRGSLHIASTNTLPLSTFFLLVDRIFAVSFLGARLDKWRRYSQWISTTCIVLNFVISVVVLIWRTLIFPPNTALTCTFSCRMKDAINDMLIVKLVISSMNMVSGGLFAVLYLKHAKSTVLRKEKKTNYTVLLVFLTEFLCTIVPTSFYLIFNQTDFVRSIRTSTMITIGHDCDGLATAVLYWYTRSGRSNTRSLVVNHMSKQASSVSTIKAPRTLSTAVVTSRVSPAPLE